MICDNLEEGDESEASALLRRVQNEPELRKVIANRLKFSAAGGKCAGPGPRKSWLTPRGLTSACITQKLMRAFPSS